jgi:hypothetical protein
MFARASNGGGVPAGHGHVYVADVANGWATVLQPPESGNVCLVGPYGWSGL